MAEKKKIIATTKTIVAKENPKTKYSDKRLTTATKLVETFLLKQGTVRQNLTEIFKKGEEFLVAKGKTSYKAEFKYLLMNTWLKK